MVLVGPAVWRILSFLIHQQRARCEPRDAVHYQQQVVLRNHGTPGSATWKLIQIAWHWRRLAKNSTLRNLPLILLAASNIFVFAIAGVFSAEVVKAAGDETLIRSPNCGSSFPNTSDSANLPSWYQWDAKQTRTASTYARACYLTTYDDSRCDRFTTPNITWTYDTTAPCPFDDDLCQPSGAYQMDSGYLNTHESLGINAKKSDRLSYRQVTTCAVLQQDNHVITNDTTVNQDLHFFYGKTGDTEHTFSYSNITADRYYSLGYTL